MSSNNSVSVQHSKPIPIDSHRRRSPSRDSNSSASPSSPFPLTTPPALPLPINPRVANNSGVSPTSPILSYFLSQSPTKGTNPETLPFRARGFGSAAVEDEDEPLSVDGSATAAGHARRASTAYAGRFSQQPPFVLPNPQPAPPDNRGAGLLRRLSLSSAFARPNVPGSAQTPTNAHVAHPAPSTPNSASVVAESVSRRKGRSATVNAGTNRRAPSPMGERILKGHFDGFN
ncbi:hypothetical protein NEOLEDRAFT_1160346 [Neolentinus lepideus HHB14362 ss-1]|uniref:Uncharacterized protein n=1 Tax=Neolentinus lepideus HHB14362 ss-1 TaxID=1314782 RepID=A0A165VLT6_9AGAM|nr:hypothetical protein NEOLEDRAFT_1160346 [Neolentinus lepideus HHB14362 ss-1]